MIKTIISEGLPVDEQLIIRKNTIQHGNGTKRICIVTGTHGDELEGQYVCFELIRRLNESIEHLNGTVEVYPALNPLGVDSVSRGIPTFDLDMNRIFPGDPNGHLIEYTAFKIVEDLKGADMVIDIHASNIFLREMPQARINVQTSRKLIPFAKMLNIDFIWIHDAATVLEATLAYSLNALKTPTIVVEMGIGMRITRTYGNRLVDGIFNMMRKMDMWHGAALKNISKPTVSTKGEVHFLNAEFSGIIIPSVSHSDIVKKGDLLCQIVDSYQGVILQNVFSPVDGLLFTLRTYPVVYEGSLLARIYSETTEK
ncbi:MAG: succinylglutamate desuccinylase [Porphyromonadaceae bacterium CG2_30_38_12]|nr:MAG: succinylglutamate desuccinylase [Porphyromonadaceae bacterium CG2_30_38_12]